MALPKCAHLARHSDPPVKQIILALDEKEKCIIQELDDTHVLIRSDRLDWLKEELENELEKNTWKGFE